MIDTYVYLCMFLSLSTLTCKCSWYLWFGDLTVSVRRPDSYTQCTDSRAALMTILWFDCHFLPLEGICCRRGEGE